MPTTDGTARSVLSITRAVEHGPERFDSPDWNVGSFSQCGPDKSSNEDGFLIVDHGPSCLFAVVVDGMGGMGNAVGATEAAIGAFEERLARWTPGESRRFAVIDAFEIAHRRVSHVAPDGGATAVAALVTDDGARVFHAGDAEGYVTTDAGFVMFRTKAHSPVGYALAGGWMEEHDAFVHPDRNFVLNGLGVEGMSIEVGPRLEFGARDTIVLASDGLTDNMTFEEIITNVVTGDPVEQLRGLGGAARERMFGEFKGDETATPGKPDDLTIVLVRR